ncbi:hypothetical protein [Microbacterium sp. W4I20]|uniref:hypothetical protein n=1 Tax=Microbacterium sp. W4I20 TaxID=3042262 RepID=UPI002785742B|nr:hypothetical protein [Microbacterium sp. W4I20]MDQ0725919.1 hypothetical protein [Microbacterium sp. W4I20]
MTMDEQQPELRWAPLEPAPKRTGRVWLIVGIAVAALVIVGVLLFLLIPRGESPDPGASASPSPSASATSTTTPSPSASPEPSETPITTPPPAADPTVEVFRGKVKGWLDTAPRGLDIIAGAVEQDGLPVLDTLQDDAQRLSDSQPPSSIQQAWSDGISAYSQRLTDLRSAITSGSGVSGAIDAARSAAQDLRGLVGL